MKKKLKKNIIICIVILVIVGLLILLYQRRVLTREQAIEDYGYENMGVYVKEENIQTEKNLEYKNIEVFNNFSGKLAMSTMAKNIKNIMIKEIPLVIAETKSLSDNELEEYFESNRENIKNNLKIEDYQSFKNMVSKFSKLKSDLENDYKICEFQQEEDYIKVKFIYENSEEIEYRLIGDSIINFSLIF